MTKTNKLQSKLWDRAGIWISAACVVHCFLSPLLVLGAAFLGSAVAWLSAEWIHAGFLLMLIPVAVIASWNGYCQHHNVGPVLLIGSGVLVLVFALLMEDILLLWGEVGITMLGSFLVIGGHLRNQVCCMRFCEGECVTN